MSEQALPRAVGTESRAGTAPLFTFIITGLWRQKNSQYLQLGGLQLPPLQEEEGSERRGRQWRGSVTFAFTTAHSKSFWASAKLHSAEALT